jgi:hypothetical protein
MEKLPKTDFNPIPQPEISSPKKPIKIEEYIDKFYSKEWSSNYFNFK